MKNRKKHLLFTLLALGILVAGINTSPFAKDIVGIANAEETGFVIDDKGILAEYNGTGSSIIIPNGVTGIGDRVFYNNTKVKSIIIPDSVTIIGDKAFWNCNNLTEITIPDSVTSIGSGAFKNCHSLAEITIPGSIKTIEGAMFSGCKNLKEIKLPDSVTVVKESSFDNCQSLANIKLPKNLVTISSGAFENCYALTGITIPDNVKTIGYCAFMGCRNITEITISENVVSIGYMAFLDCKKLTSVTIPDKTATLGDDIFSGCPALKKIMVKQGNKKYQSKDGVLFKKVQSGLELVVYPAAKKGKTYTVPAKTSNIEYGAFSGCKKLTGIVLPSNIKKIEYKNGSFFGFVGLKNLKVNMKKDQKLNISFIIDYDSEYGSAIPEVTINNKNIAGVTMPLNWESKNNKDIDYIKAYTLKGNVKAKKKGKAKIVFNREVIHKKKVNNKEIKLENVKLKTTMEIVIE